MAALFSCSQQVGFLTLLVAGALHAQRDPSPHREVRVTTAPGVRIQVLDWGGTGPAILMVPGYGFSAHIYDDLAPRLKGYRVLAITVRGWPPSDAPASGYTYDAVANDLLAVIDSLHLGPTVLVGHSFGGALITRVAAKEAGRIRALIYLDGALQSAPRDSIFRLNPVRRPPPPEAPDTTLRSQIDTWHRYAEGYFYGTWAPALEADLWARGSGMTDQEFARRDSLIRRFGMEDARDKAQADFGSFPQPSLAICSITTARYQYPWLADGSPDWPAAQRFTTELLIPFQRRECGTFRSTARRGETVELESGHYVFLNRPDRTVEEMLKFLAQLPR